MRLRTKTDIPEFLPGKRALAIGLCVYHSILSTILFQAPRFIPFTLGPFFEASVAVFSPLRPALILRLDLQVQDHSRNCLGLYARLHGPWLRRVVAGHRGVCTDDEEGRIDSSFELHRAQSVLVWLNALVSKLW